VSCVLLGTAKQTAKQQQHRLFWGNKGPHFPSICLTSTSQRTTTTTAEGQSFINGWAIVVRLPLFVEINWCYTNE